MGLTCAVVAETKLLAMRRWCDSALEDRGTRCLQNLCFCWEEARWVEEADLQVPYERCVSASPHREPGALQPCVALWSALVTRRYRQSLPVFQECLDRRRVTDAEAG